MYIVNISFFVEPDVHGRWLDVMKREFLPLVAECGFHEVVFSRVLPQGDECEGVVHSLMVRGSDRAWCEIATGELTEKYKAIALPLFGHGTQWFTTIMEADEDITL